MQSVARWSGSGPKFISLLEFGTRYRCSRSTTYRLAQSGAIKIVKRGRSSLISLEEAEIWASSLPALG
jgi:hypothetical protein